MASEIERKYLVTGNEWQNLPFKSKTTIVQGYVRKDCDIRMVFHRSGCVSMEFVGDAERINFDATYDPATNDFDKVADLPNYDRVHQVFKLDDQTVFRLRSRSNGADKRAYITIKRFTGNAERNQEFEIEIPQRRVDALKHAFLVNTVRKIRHEIEYAGRIWEVDVFKDHLKGLIMAEIEVATESEFAEIEKNLLPGLGQNVTQDRRYSNEMLGRNGIPAYSK